MSELSYEDIELLMESLDALEKKGGSGRMVGSLLGLMLSRDEEQRDEMLDKLHPDSETERDEKLLAERIIIIKAKLLSMRDKAEAHELTVE